MGFFSKIKKGFKKVVSFAGGIVKPVVTGLATVVNPVLGGVVGGVFGATSKRSEGSAPYSAQTQPTFSKYNVNNPYGENPLTGGSVTVQPPTDMSLGGLNKNYLIIGAGAVVLLLVLKR